MRDPTIYYNSLQFCAVVQKMSLPSSTMSTELNNDMFTFPILHWHTLDLHELLNADYAHILFSNDSCIGFYKPQQNDQIELFVIELGLWFLYRTYVILSFFFTKDTNKCTFFKHKNFRCIGQSFVRVSNHLLFFGGDSSLQLTLISTATPHHNMSSLQTLHLPKPTNVLYDIDLSKGVINKIHPKKTTPSPRYGHSAVAYNDTMIIFGGQNSKTFFNDLYQYNPCLLIFLRNSFFIIFLICSFVFYCFHLLFLLLFI